MCHYLNLCTGGGDLPEIQDGQFIINTSTGQVYLDHDGSRTPIVGSGNPFAGTALPTGTDINTIITPGVYYASGETCPTLINIPQWLIDHPEGFSLVVYPTTELGITVCQVLRPCTHNNSPKWERYVLSSSVTDWYVQYDEKFVCLYYFKYFGSAMNTYIWSGTLGPGGKISVDISYLVRFNNNYMYPIMIYMIAKTSTGKNCVLFPPLSGGLMTYFALPDGQVMQLHLETHWATGSSEIQVTVGSNSTAGVSLQYIYGIYPDVMARPSKY